MNKNSKKESKGKEKYICQSDLISRGWTKKLIEEFLPPPMYKRNPHYASAPAMKVWPEKLIIETEYSEGFQAKYQKVIEKRKNAIKKKEDRDSAMRETVKSLIPDNPIDEYPLARSIKRKFILHVGPTNSGKTHDSLERLKRAQTGVYLGPLRLLALEVYDKFNADGIPCSMITGEEMIANPSAKITASTIEMMDTSIHYEVVVIDEVQMIGDKYRGHNWTKAILGMCADEIHLCMAPEAQKIAVRLIEECGDSYEVIYHKRSTELKFDHSRVEFSSIETGDALIVFSRNAVLSLAAELEEKGIMASVIYGNLPPSSRREQVRKFLEGETTVVVSTDAIGMGMNLPIKRVVFMETRKYDGEKTRKLLPQEIKQIAGRAGRYGMFDEGYVLSVSDGDYIEKALSQETSSIDYAYLGFSEEIASLPYPLPSIAMIWSNIGTPGLYRKMELTEMINLYNCLLMRTRVIASCARDAVYRMITCSVDGKNRVVEHLWLEYCERYIKGNPLRFPTAVSNQLSDMETLYKCLDLYYQFSRRLKLPYDENKVIEEKEKTAREINKILRKSKAKHQRRCKVCEKPLPFNHPYKICNACYEESDIYDYIGL